MDTQDETLYAAIDSYIHIYVKDQMVGIKLIQQNLKIVHHADYLREQFNCLTTQVQRK